MSSTFSWDSRAASKKLDWKFKLQLYKLNLMMKFMEKDQ